MNPIEELFSKVKYIMKSNEVVLQELDLDIQVLYGFASLLLKTVNIGLSTLDTPKVYDQSSHTLVHHSLLLIIVMWHYDCNS